MIGMLSRPRRILVLGALVLGACATRPNAPQPTPGDPLAGLESYVERAVADWGIAGLAIAVVEGDSVVFASGFGARDVRTGDAVDEHSIFAIGSNTKLFTSIGAGILVDEGRMAWDDPATAHLPELQLHDPVVTREITIRDLLSHRSGLGRRGDLLWYGSGLNRDEILRRIRHLEPNTSFRSRFGYQNIMYLAAGEAVGRTAGVGWDAFTEQRILQPLGMHRSSTSLDALDRLENVATPHLYDEGELVPVPYRNVDNIGPAGSITSSVHDMAQWLRMLLGDGRYDGRQLVDSATLAEILTPHTLMDVEPDSLFPSTHFVTYGLGMVLQDYRGTRIAWHTGGIDGMLSLVGLLPEQDVGLVVLTNTAGHNNLFTALMYRVFDAYLGAAPRDWSGLLLQRLEEQQAAAAAQREDGGDSRVAGTVPSLDLSEYAGRYRHPMYGDLQIDQRGDDLVLRFGPTFVADLEHWHYDTFRPVWREGSGIADTLTRVTFHLNAAGRIAALRLPAIGDFERVPEPEG